MDFRGWTKQSTDALVICGRITDRLTKAFHNIEPAFVKLQNGQTSQYLEALWYPACPRAADEQLVLFLDDGPQQNPNPVCTTRPSSIPLV